MELMTSPSRRSGWLSWMGNVLLFNQALAVPIGLLMVSSGVSWQTGLVVATTYTQIVGTCCFLAGTLVHRCGDSLKPSQRLPASLASNFVSGAIGSLIAGSLVSSVFGHPISGHTFLLSVGTGASVAMLVGIGRSSLRQLRVALEASEQRLRDRELAEERLLTAKTEAELMALQARINPHFLFNTLNSIAALIGDEPEKAEQLVGRLSSLLRYALQSNRRGVVSLDEELTIVRGYLEIEQVRLGGRLRYDIDVDPSLRAVDVPVLLLQPLVENAIKHGIAPKIDGGRVSVRGWREEDFAIFSIADDGDGEGSGHGAGMGEGLDNVRHRLDALYGDRASVTLAHRDGRTEARVMLPLPRDLPTGAAS
jgi:glucose-6-phosphate-specific signal transduction histidine kinase